MVQHKKQNNGLWGLPHLLLMLPSPSQSNQNFICFEYTKELPKLKSFRTTQGGCVHQSCFLAPHSFTIFMAYAMVGENVGLWRGFIRLCLVPLLELTLLWKTGRRSFFLSRNLCFCHCKDCLLVYNCHPVSDLWVYLSLWNMGLMSILQSPLFVMTKIQISLFYLINWAARKWGRRGRRSIGAGQKRGREARWSVSSRLSRREAKFRTSTQALLSKFWSRSGLAARARSRSPFNQTHDR